MNGDNETYTSARGQGEYAWPALLLIFLILGGLPHGPVPASMATAGEKAGVKAAHDLDKDLDVVGSPESSASTPESAAPTAEEGKPVPEEHLPSPPEDLDQIEQQAEGLLAGKKFDAAADFVRENEAALAVSFRLKQILLEALIQTENPNWVDVGNRAEALLEESPADPVGNLALGMSWANRKTPDAAKALTYLAKAKDSKRALAMAGAVYWKFWAKKNWYGLVGILALVLGGGFAVARARKRRRQAEEELANALGGAPPARESEAPSGSNAVDEPRPAARAGISPAAAKTTEQASRKTVPGTDQKPGPDMKPEQAPEPIPGPADEARAPAKEPVTESSVPVSERPPALTSGPATVAPPDVTLRSEPSASTPAAHAAHIPHARATEVLPAIDLAAANLGPGGLAPSRPPHLPGREAEAVWQNLVRQATSRPIPLDVREPAPPPPPPPVIDPAQAGDVTLDLSDASMTEDLVTKLRMLAITDGELRKLLQMRNPEHLPALVEYITMKPDPVRLAFMAREMGHYHDPAVSEILSTLLYHPDHRVTLSAIQGLQINGGSESVAVVCPFLESDVPVLVEAARAALTEFGPRLVLEGLARLPSHPDERVRSGGVFVLSRMKGDAVSRLLVAMLGDPSSEVRRKVLLAMAYQKNPAYIPTLREFVRQAPDEDRKVARKAIVFLQSMERKPG
ncbi:MAG TPA: HEAT repeat domain-containing protein [Candidatus Ozemobacteraceae bacterium]|nr:HEAT repeat domain-containing protein [Candidatus Ozemobacteraceae bacterium]HQG27792.1 HEAT repeat domain-containing protein [Candidatus Ozemobacteraceae bacterium]